ncbi:serine hydrolase [Sporomusa aerivorans]|uniref:serine hydrolase n=1 Tax=Sporomusa aerivorans TaxID=204936 RepID=UPI00352B1B2E
MSFTIFLKRLPVIITGLALILIWAAQPAFAGYYPLPPYERPAKPTALDKKLLAAMEDHKIVGLSAAVFTNNKLIWSGGYGWADLRTSRPVTADTVFRMASLSKMVTATALMQLYDQGKFNLDDDISAYLGYPVRNPNYPDVKITFRQLLNHTSSIVDSRAYNSLVAGTPELLQEVNIRDMLVPKGRYYDPDTFADYAPGSQFSYSNFGTGIIGSLVEKISGISFEQYCSRFIFSPIGMDASFEPADIKNWRNVAVLYRPTGQIQAFRPTKDDYQGVKPESAPITASALSHSPAGGLRSSAVDFAKFMQAHMNYNRNRILKADTSDLMHQLQWFGDSMHGFYKQKGLNFHITDDLVPGKRLVGHSGEAYGLASDAYYDQDSNLGIVFMMNGADLSDANPYYTAETDIAKTLFDAFAPGGSSKKPRQIKTKANTPLVIVNNRKIILPAPAVISKAGKTQSLYLPAISVADALAVGIEQAKDEFTFTSGQKKAILKIGRPTIIADGRTIVLPQAPYMNNGHAMIPIRELAAALNLNAKISS